VNGSLDAPLVGWPAFAHVAIFAIALPYGAWLSGRRLAHSDLPPRLNHFAAVILQQLIFGAIAIAVANWGGVTLLPSALPSAVDWAMGGAFLATAVAWSEPQWQQAIRERDRRVHLVAPRLPSERVLWAGVASAAGVFEEIAYRGVLFAILQSWTGSGVAAAAIAATAFGAAHLVQGRKASGYVVVIGLGFHALVWATGGLVVAIAVHIAFDLIAGYRIAHLADEAGLPLEAPSVAIGSPARTPS